VRSVRAFRVRAARGRRAIAATGALGISSRICATAGKTRRIATSIPPALTFSEVANSRNSLPLSSLLRTKTGIASGSRAHLRRSLADLPPFMADLSIAPLTWLKLHLRGQIGLQLTRKTIPNFGEIRSTTAKSINQRLFSAVIFAFNSLSKTSLLLLRTAPKCKLLLHLGKSSAFFVDNRMPLSYASFTDAQR